MKENIDSLNKTNEEIKEQNALFDYETNREAEMSQLELQQENIEKMKKELNNKTDILRKLKEKSP